MMEAATAMEVMEALGLVSVAATTSQDDVQVMPMMEAPTAMEDMEALVLVVEMQTVKVKPQ